MTSQGAQRDVAVIESAMNFLLVTKGDVMSVTTLEGIVENGHVRLPADVVLPEQQTVYVVVPNAVASTTRKLPGVRLANPEDAAKFEMKVTWGEAP